MTPGPWYPGAHLDSPEKPAYIMAETGEQISYAELHQQAAQLAQLFRNCGLQVEDHIAIGIENRLEAAVLMWGAHYAGLYYTFLSTRLTAQEADFIINDCGARVVVLSDQMCERWLEHLVVGLPNVKIMSVGPVVGLDDVMEFAGRVPPLDMDSALEGVDMLYSSGTTGQPKGVKRPFSNLPVGTTTKVVDLGRSLLDLNSESVYLSPAPFYHAAPLIWVRDMAAIGGTAVLMEKFDAQEVLADIDRWNVTHAQFVPTMLVRLVRLPDEVKRGYHLASLRAAIHAAAPCPPDIKRAILDWWGPIVHEYYGGTEGNGFSWCTPQEWLAHPGTVGKPLVGIAHIVGEDGNELPVGSEGVVYFEGGYDFEYHNDAAKTAAAKMNGGWSTLGDVGRLDEEGFLYLTDRLSNTIISGGVNIYPQEAENVLAAHPAVLDVAVIGVPSEEFGEDVKAVVQLSDGYAPTDVLAGELMSLCRSRLAGVKCPKSVEFRAALPRTPTGKLLKRLIRDEFWVGRDSRI